MTRNIVIAAVLLLSLNGCTLLVGSVVGGVVGAALTPLVTPQADRVLYTLGLDFIDPDGTDKVKQYDKKKGTE